MSANVQQRVETNVHILVQHDDSPDTSYLDQEGFEDRRAAYYNDEFCFVGVRVSVEIHNWTTGVHTTIQSAGLWGIESDSGEDYLRGVGLEELEQLRSELTERNIDISGIKPQLVLR